MYRQRLGKLSAHLDIPLKKEQTILVLLIDKYVISHNMFFFLNVFSILFNVL